METKRILMTSTFFPPYHLGGDATHVRMLKDELQGQGHEVYVLHSLDAYLLKSSGEMPPSSPDPTVHAVSSPLGKWSARATYLTGRNRRAEKELQRLVAEIRPNWVHHHNVSLLGAGMLRDRGVPNIYTAHDYWLACPRSDLMYRGRATCERRSCTSCSLASGRPPQIWRAWREDGMVRPLRAVIAPSRFMASKLKRFLDVDATLLPNFAPRPAGMKARTSSGEHFSFLGVLERSKGLDIVLDAFSRKEVKAELHVMGRGSLEQEVRRAERETGGRISYKGFISGPPLWDEMASSIALLAPSIGNENSPLACIEALSRGLPLIVSERGGLPELVQEPECGLISALEPEALARSVNQLAEDPGLVRRLSEGAFIRYERYHSPERYLASYLSLCEKVSK
jgi:glycosyltransferase involved in cell wall biosynthesis